MNPDVASPWDKLSRFDADQHRFLVNCLGRHPDPVMPFAGPYTTLRAVPRGQQEPRADAVRISYAAADGTEHLDAVLYQGDLHALGMGPRVLRRPFEQALAELLGSMLQLSLRRASRLLRGDVTLGVQRMPATEALPELPWHSFIEEAVPPLERLHFRISPALLAACEEQLMPHLRPASMRRIPLVWDVQLRNIPLQRGQFQGLAEGDLLRVSSSPLSQAELVGELLPQSDPARGLRRAAGSPRRVKVVIDGGRWIALKFEQENPAEYPMNEPESPDNPIVPVSLTLPVAAMSLQQIDRTKPGTLVDTGVRLQDVEVGLWSAGHRFASGRLVVIGENLGVEISRIERDRP